MSQVPPPLPRPPGSSTNAAQPIKISRPPKSSNESAKYIVWIVVLCVGFLGFKVIRGINNTPSQKSAGEIAFNEANKSIITHKNGVYQGNTEAAQKLAEQFSKEVELFRKLAITKGEKNAFSLSNGQFITHCQLTGDRCAFLMHVPELRKFSADAKEALNRLAWESAWRIVKDSKQPVGELAIGLKGALSYSAIYIAPFDPNLNESGPIAVEASGIMATTKLHRFFEPDTPASSPQVDQATPADPVRFNTDTPKDDEI